VRNWSSAIEAAHAVARAHLAPRGATLTVTEHADGIVLRVANNTLVYEEFLYLLDRISPSREEYVHCRTHEVVAKFIRPDLDFDAG